MRKIKELNKLVLIVLVGFFVLVVSCEKDNEVKDEETNEIDPIENIFTYNGTDYNTPKAIILNCGELEGEVNEFEISFYSSSITYTDEDGGTISGKGELVQIFLETSIVTDSLPTGKYLDEGETNYFYDAEIGIGADMDSDEDIGTYLEVTGGELNVSKAGLVYTIKYTFQLDNGKELTGSYKGEIDHIIDAY